MHNIKKISIVFIYFVLTLVFPMYRWMADGTSVLLMNGPYFLALLCSFAIFASERDRGNKSRIVLYLLIFVLSISLILIINILCIPGTNEKYSISELITCSQAWLAFLAGRYITSLIHQRYFSIVNIIIWAANCYFIISRIDLGSMQAIYGAEDPMFSGAYQYIGDTFSFVSIILISQLIGSGNDRRLMEKLKIFRGIDDLVMGKLKILICLCLILICDILIFLNGSRSSFFSFTCIFLLLIIRMRKMIFRPAMLGLIIIISSILVTIAFNTFNIEMMLENRNLEFILNNGQSASLESRTEFHDSGLSDIYEHFFIGNYTQVSIEGNEGNYIHNALGIWQYYGIVPFACFGLSMFESIKKYLSIFKSTNSCENIAYESTLLFSTLSVLLFRNPIGFNVVFITFGICSTISMPMHYREILPLKERIFDRRSDAISPDRHSVASDLEFAIAYSHRQHQFATALVDYDRQAVSCEPEFAIAYSDRGNIRRRQGDFATALVDYDRAISLDRSLTVAYYNRGICHRQIGNHQAAIDDYTQTLALDPQYCHAYYHRGNARQYLGDKHGAIADYTQTIRCDPDRIHAHYNRAIIRSQIRDIHGAMADLERAIELQPTFTLAYYQRGWLLSLQDRHQAAIADYQRAIELKPDYLDAYYQRGCSHQSWGDLSAALADFNHCIDIEPNYAPAYYQRGKVFTQLRDRSGAIADYHKAANLYLDRGDSSTYQQILQVLHYLSS